MRQRKMNDTMPGDAVVETSIAYDMVSRLTRKDAALGQKLMQLGLVQGEPYKRGWHVDWEKVGLHFSKHCVVIMRGLASAYWPLFRKRTKEPIETILCTCSLFCMHADANMSWEERGPAPPDHPNNPILLASEPSCRLILTAR